jgi:hypothetical protein
VHVLRMTEWARAMEEADDPGQWLRANHAFHTGSAP